MRVRAAGLLAMAAAFALFAVPKTASACHACHKSPCALVAAPAYQCVTEMVPYTVYKTRTKLTYQPVTQTIMVPEPKTTIVERPRIVCRPFWEDQKLQRTVYVCREVPYTTTVTEYYTVYKPQTTTRQVVNYYLQASTQLVSVPVMVSKCGHCGKAKTVCGCSIVAQTCYTPVPYLQNVTCTVMVPEVLSRQVPVNGVKIVTEPKVETITVKVCRIIQETVIDKFPVTTCTYVPKQITRQVCVPICETYAEVCYRPVQHLVACAPAYYPTPAPTPMPTPAPTPQT